MTDKKRVADAFARHFSQYEQEAGVQREMASKLDAALAEFPEKRVGRALEIGIGTGFLTRLITQRYPHAEWWFNDLTPAAFDWLPVGMQQAFTLPGDAEAIGYPVRLDLIASASAIQWFDDLPRFFRKARSVLTDHGLLAIATFGDHNLHEIAELTAKRLPCPSLNELRAIANDAGFQLLQAEEWSHTLHFPTAHSLLAHLHHTGVNGTSTGSIRTPAQLKAFETSYRLRFGTRHGLPLTYHPLLLLGCKE